MNINQGVYDNLSDSTVNEFLKVLDTCVDMSSWSSELRLSAFGARLCYTSMPFLDLLSDSKINGENCYTFLRKISAENHGSVFEHCNVFLDIKKSTVDRMTKGEAFEFELGEIAKLIPGLEFFLNYTDLSEMAFPSYRNVAEHVESTVTSHAQIVTTAMAASLVGCGWNNGSTGIRVNFRTYLELAKRVGKEQEVWSKIITNEMKPIEVLSSKELSFGGKVHVLKLDANSEVPSMTCLIENVSRVATHQLVRHRHLCAFSQRSDRHTNFTKNAASEMFVAPPLPYIEKTLGAKERENVQELMRASYSSAVDIYKALTDGVSGADSKVNKEDARFVLPNSMCTKILFSSYGIGLSNFLKLRTKTEAQWEIREVAEYIASIM